MLYTVFLLSKQDANITKEHLEKVEAELEERKQENKAVNALLDQLQDDNSRLSKKVERLEKTGIFSVNLLNTTFIKTPLCTLCKP